MKRPCLLSLRWAYPGPESHLNLLPPTILDKLVHLVAQVPHERVGPQGASGLLSLLQLLLQQGEPIQQLEQDQGQGRAGALREEAQGKGTGSCVEGVQAAGSLEQVGGTRSYLGQEHHVDAWPQRQAVHGVRHHGVVALFHTGIQENPSGTGRCWGVRDQRLEGVFSYLCRKKNYCGKGRVLSGLLPMSDPPTAAHSPSSL